MKLISMIALEDFEFDGTSYAAQQRLEVPPVYASIFRRKQYARFTTEHDLIPEPPPPPVEPPMRTQALTVTRRKPRRKRRDIAKPQHTT